MMNRSIEASYRLLRQVKVLADDAERALHSVTFSYMRIVLFSYLPNSNFALIYRSSGDCEISRIA